MKGSDTIGGDGMPGIAETYVKKNASPFGFGSTTIGASSARLLADVSKKLSEGG